MFNDLKLAFQSFNKNFGDYISIAFVFGMILFIGVLVSEFLFGPLISYIAVVIPAIISVRTLLPRSLILKSFSSLFMRFHSSNKI